MWRVAAFLMILFAVGCGDGAREDAATDPSACPAGTEPLTVRDALGPVPRGYELVRGNRQRINAIAEEFREEIGDEVWRGHAGRVLVRRGRQEGAALIVVNTNERGLERVVAELERTESARGETLDVGDREGWIAQTPGGWLAIAPAGECSLLLLTAASEALIRDAASHVGAGG